MFHIMLWTYYKTYYIKACQPRKQLVNAQNKYFENEGFAIPLNIAQVEILMGNSDDITVGHNKENITFDANTTMNDWIEATYVLEKCCNRLFLLHDL